MQANDFPVWAAIQPNGEQLRYERWAIEAWRNGTLTDPLLPRGLVNAVEIRPAGWPRTKDGR